MSAFFPTSRLPTSSSRASAAAASMVMARITSSAVMPQLRAAHGGHEPQVLGGAGARVEVGAESHPRARVEQPAGRRVAALAQEEGGAGQQHRHRDALGRRAGGRQAPRCPRR